MKRISFVTLGCKTNQFESAAMAEAAAKEGLLIVPAHEQADIVVINTCTVTARTDAESRRLVRRARRENPSARIVVAGCYSQLAPETFRDFPGVSLIIGNSEKRELMDLLQESDSGQLVKVSDISREETATPLIIESFAEHTRAFMQVQNGCDSRCSYCIVPHVRGRSRSVPLESALEGIRAFARQSFREVVLTGIHLGAFGLDRQPPTSLFDLVSQAEQERIVPRLRLGSIEPTEITDDLIRLMATAESICPHLHIPLQSGNDRTLAAMNRPYTTGFFRKITEKLAAAVPGIFIGTDIIAGFPGESDEDFQQGYCFLESLPMATFHVFPFSPRQGTPAASMPGQVPANVIKERAEALRRLSEEKKRKFFEGFLGRELDVLIQEKGKNDTLKGLSRNYIPVALPEGSAALNSEVKVKITEVEKDFVRGRLA
ncbi:MAG: tRNA (N(6)-L-threonylcarbamoyladenosine(37)-C(2))-methylthiotransferase MtaB [Geobacteraceae bacterium]|nr:tRNA (N(6)-L-threonylcarbamoyladenosine(37)-C(2))-methylthiotransferase MtaB [Geobacteraceae bacterium]